MILFFAGIALLVFGYFTYGSFIMRQLAPDDRKTPAHLNRDGVDYLRLPHWKNMLIQLLNIAGVGPVIGVIFGAKFGAIVFIIIPLGNIFAGATHDALGAMMSMRQNGAALPKVIRANLGNHFYKFFSCFTLLLLILVVAVFVDIPSDLIVRSLPENAGGFSVDGLTLLSLLLIFCYYLVATLFPVDKIIGRIYPLFGLMLLLGTLGIFFFLCKELFANPELLSESAHFKGVKWTGANGHPIIPMLFVTIACGIISGFHATQSPIVVRTLDSERQMKSTFYGMMILEGVIAMIWAAVGLAVYNKFPEMFSENPTEVLFGASDYFLGKYFGLITILSIVILAISSGDTAMRGIRLILAEIFGLEQKNILKRLILILPIIIVCGAFLIWRKGNEGSFDILWRYFAWSNQVLATCTLFAATVWMKRRGMKYFIALVPAAFMSFIVLSFILWASPEQGGVIGFGLGLNLAYLISALLTGSILACIFVREKHLKDIQQ